MWLTATDPMFPFPFFPEGRVSSAIEVGPLEGRIVLRGGLENPDLQTEVRTRI